MEFLFNDTSFWISSYKDQLLTTCRCLICGITNYEKLLKIVQCRREKILLSCIASTLVAFFCFRSRNRDFKEPYRFTIYYNAVCSHPKGGFVSGDILVMVKSTPNHSRHREAIRSTWANPCWTKRYKKRYKVLFIMGTHVGEDHRIVHSHLQLEFHTNRDIVQYDFPDTYKLTTRKLLAAWSFAKRACPLFRYVLIVDEDFLISPNLLMKTVLQVPEREYKDYIGGHLYPMSKPYRNNRSKYYIAREDYPYPVFPPFVAGGFMLISMPVARRLLDNLVKTQIFLPLDDVTVGLALRRIDVKPKHIRNICLHDYNCKHVAHKARIGVHGFSDPQHLIRDWKRLQLGAAC